MTYITHITLATGHTSRIQKGDVAGETAARVGPWLAALVASGQPMPLPVSSLSEYTALAVMLDGALIVTISGPPVKTGPMSGKAPPLVTVGLAKKSRHAHLWSLLTGPVMPPVAAGIKCPSTPWCAVAIHPTIAMHTSALEWLGDFERCIAWAWVGK